jgi:tetratricopeptide (TPR) repeat protein
MLATICVVQSVPARSQGGANAGALPPDKQIAQQEQQLAAERAVQATKLLQLGLDYSIAGDRALDKGDLVQSAALYQKELETYSEALPIEQGLGDRSREAVALNGMGQAYCDLNQPQKAIDNLMLALPIRREVADLKGDGVTLGNLGGAYYALGDMDKAIEYWKEALPIKAKLNSLKDEETILTNIALTYSNQDMDDEALDFYDQALSMARVGKDLKGEASALDTIGEIYFGQDDLTKAQENYNQALEIDLALHDTELEAQILNDIGLVYDEQGDPDKALASFYKAAPLAHDAGDPRDEGAILGNAGDVYAGLGEQDMALELYNRSIPLRHAAEDRGGEGATLSNAGEMYRELEQNEQARDYLNRALTIQVAVGDQSGQANTLDNLGAVYDALEERKEALAAYQQALPLRTEEAAKDHGVGEAHTRSNIGEIYLDMEEAQNALDSLEQALPIQQKLDHKEEAETLDYMGIAYEKLTKMPESLEYFERELVVRRELSDRRGEGATLTDIGEVYIDQGKLEQGLETLNEALPIRREMNDPKGEAETLDDIGEVYFGLGQRDEALRYFTLARPIQHAIKDAKGEASTLNSIGTVYYYLGDKDEELKFYGQALDLEQATPDDEKEQATTLNNMGTVYSYKGEQQTALEYYKKALPIRHDVGDKSGEAYTLWCIGQNGLTDAKTALRYNMAALKLAEEAGDPDLQGEIETSLMGYFSRQNRPEAAILLGLDAINSYQSIRRNITGLGKELQASFAKSKSATYRELAELLVQNNRLGEAERVLDLLKEAELDEVVRGGAADPGAKVATVPLTPTQQNAEKALVQPEITALDVTDLSYEYKLLMDKGTSRNPEEQVRYLALDQQVTADDDKFDKFLDEDFFLELKAKDGVEQANTTKLGEDSQESNFQQILKHLGTGVLGIRLLIAEHVYAIVVTGTTHECFELKITPKDLDSLILQVHGELKLYTSDPKPDLATLYNLIVGPMEGELRSLEQDSGEKDRAPTLLWSLDKGLKYLPMAALYDGKQYLAERFNNVLFTPDSYAALISVTDANAPPLRGLAMGLTRSYEGLDALSWVMPELESVVHDPTIPDSHGPMDGRLLPDEKFTLAAMKTLVGPTYPVVHIASHFVIQTGSGTEPFLMLGGKDEGDAAGYHLTLRNLRGAHLDFEGTRLLALSACSTAQGDTNQDGEDMESMQQVTQQEGAQAVLATLWDVGDASTSELMSDFYARWVKHPELGKAEALRQAQLAFLHGKGPVTDDERGFKTVSQPAAATKPTDYSHPYFWAPFVLTGNYR